MAREKRRNGEETSKKKAAARQASKTCRGAASARQNASVAAKKISGEIFCTLRLRVRRAAQRRLPAPLTRLAPRGQHDAVAARRARSKHGKIRHKRHQHQQKQAAAENNIRQ